MLRHVVMFRWNESVDGEHVGAVSAGLDGLAATIPGIRSYHHGTDVAVNDGNFDYAVVADFDNVEDYLVYRDHPLHQDFIRELIAGKIAAPPYAISYSPANVILPSTSSSSARATTAAARLASFMRRSHPRRFASPGRTSMMRLHSHSERHSCFASRSVTMSTP